MMRISLLFVAILAMVPAPRPGGEESPMLMERIEGSRYERRSYGRDGEPAGQQIIEVGSALNSEGITTLSLSFQTLEDGKVTDRFTTTWTCRGPAAAMLMTLLVVSPEKRKVKVNLEAESRGSLYPLAETSPTELGDVGISIRIKQGLASTFGARSRLTLRERRLEELEEGRSDAAYRLRSEIEIRASVLGIRVKQIRFESEELLDRNGELVRQTIRSPKGGYSEIRRLPPREPPA